MKSFFKVRTGKLVETIALWPNGHLNWFNHAGVICLYFQLAFVLWYVEVSYNIVKCNEKD